MDFVTPIITPIVESLLVPVKRHMSFVVSSSNYVRDMHAKMTQLNDIACDMHTKQMQNYAKRLTVPHHVPIWLEEVEKLKAEIAEIAPMNRVTCFNMKMRYKAGKKSFNIIMDIDRLMNEKSEIQWTDEQIPLGKVSSQKPSTSTATYDDDEDDVGTLNRHESSRDVIFNKALKFLEANDNKARKMALCGMGGVGKTTMMEQLKKVVEDRKMFDWIVKVVIGNDLNPIIIQQTIADYIGQPLTERTKDARAECLQKRFKGMSEEGKKKILIILDDVWEEFNLKDVGLTTPLPNGFKLLLTSREESVCTRMGIEASSIFRIEVLKEPEAKALFWEIVGLVSHSDILPIGEEIIKRCGGLPIAINTIACALREREIYAWEDTLYRLHNKEFRVLDNIFEISYNNLKEDDKATFLLCGLFPEDYNIDIEALLRYGWGLKLFKNVHTIAKGRRRVKTCIDNLIRSNLLIKSDYEGFVKMHDLVRDFVLSSFSKLKQASIVAHDNSFFEQLKEDESYERILIKCVGSLEFHQDFNYPYLTLLMLMAGYKELKFPQDFYTRMVKLEVVAYVNTYRPMLPRYSANLRALTLRSCRLMHADLSFLGDLVNLEVLDLAQCSIHKLPSKIGELKRLKLLDITGCVGLCIEDGVFLKLEKLEELYMIVSRGLHVRFTDANWDELKILSRNLTTLEIEFVEYNAQLKYVSFEKLERFRIHIGCLSQSYRFFWGDNDPYSLKNTLQLVSSSEQLLECKINELFRSTEILCLEVNDMSYLEDILMCSPKNSFCNLKALYISKCVNLTYLFTIPVAEGLTKLEILEIQSCTIMQSVIHSENRGSTVIKFDKLKHLYLKDLPELVCLCDPLNVILELPQLLKLRLDELQHFTSIFPEKNMTNISAKQPLFNNKVPKLKTLEIGSMKHLKEIWSCEDDVDNIPILREIVVEDCNSLLYIFPSNPMRLLGHLERLKVGNCGSIEALFDMDMCKIEQLSSNTALKIIEVRRCDNFREVWRLKDVENNYSGLLISSFQAVETISIHFCKRFRHFVTPATANFDLTAVKNIRIQESGEYGDSTCEFDKTTKEQEGMKVLFEMESTKNRDELITTQQPIPLLPYLEDIHLEKMHNMTHVWKCSNWNELFIPHDQLRSSLQNLTTIRLGYCPSIKYLFSPLMLKLLSNLKEVRIYFCNGIEEVVSNRDDKHDEIMSPAFTHTTTEFFPRLNLLDLYYLNQLNRIGGGATAKISQVGVVSWSLSQYCTKICIFGCDALSSVIPVGYQGLLKLSQNLRMF